MPVVRAGMARIMILMAVLLVVVGHPALGQAPPEILGTPPALPPGQPFPAFPPPTVSGSPFPTAPVFPPPLVSPPGSSVPDPAPLTSGQVGSGVPLDGGVVPAPMYVPDPSDLGGFAALPQAVATDILPEWPRWFAGASGLIMTRTLPSSTATMQPSTGL
ncbi:MAG: hypothetical protein RLZZ326_3283, partial [Planctomycetota bacterium]